VLHIKLPKGKVAAACERAADQCSRRIAVENQRYSAQVGSWQKTKRKYEVLPPHPSRVLDMTADRKRLHDMADACGYSTGDVYVSTELWNQIKGYYDG